MFVTGCGDFEVYAAVLRLFVTLLQVVVVSRYMQQLLECLSHCYR